MGVRLLTASVLALAVAACSGENETDAETTAAEEAAGAANDALADADDAADAAVEEAEDIAEVALTPEEIAKLAADNLAASTKFLEENAKKDGVKVTDDGLQYMVLKEGDKSLARPETGELIDVEYVATKMDGVEFDSSRARGVALARFKLDETTPNAAWLKGVKLMHPGDRYRFFVPPSLAYGEAGAPPRVGPNEAVIFEMELAKVVSPDRSLAAAEKFLSENAEKEGVTSTETGLQYEVISEGPADGKKPTAADAVKVHYKGTLLDGTEFDSSYSRGQPAEFPLGRVIAGWTEGLQLMREGDKYRLFVPPSLGYGESGTPGGPIGPNEALIFEVELIEVK